MNLKVDKGDFRADLFYRINVFPIDVPRLSERAVDIPLILKRILEDFGSSGELPENFPVGDEKTLIGEIALCEEIIYEESKKYKKIFENRLKHMIIHGLLHLIGFDHIKKEEENKMESIEKKIMKSLSAGDPY